jgi:dTDP-4-amino-4,6-dideoxygalactose transaminase
MATVSQLQSKVPFVDLNAQYAGVKNEILDAVHKVIDSTHFVGGQFVEQFEEAFARYTGASYAAGVASGTAALELAFKAAGIKRDDELIVPANSFFATAEAVSNVGAVPVFADICAETFHMNASSVEERITPRTRAIIPVHLYGRAMDLRALESVAAKHGLQLIEDAAQAHGVGFAGRPVGSSGHLCCFSFYPGKNLGAYGDAGAVTTSDPKMLERLRMLRDHGSPSKYQHSLIGTNGRLDAIQAAVLCVKLKYLDDWNSSRVRHAERYIKQLARCKIVVPYIPADGEHNVHLFVIRIKQRDKLLKFLQDRAIGCAIHYPVPLHLTKAYQDLGYPGIGSLPITEGIAQEIVSLPMFPELTDQQIDYVAETVEEFCNEHSG